MVSSAGSGNSPFNINFGEALGRLKLPSMPDMDALVATQWRNFEALTAANVAALEGAQAVVRRNVEMMTQTMAELSENTIAIAGLQNPGEKAAKQVELMKKACERAMIHLNEVGEMLQHANAGAVEVLQKRFNEAMDEVKALTQQAKEPDAGA